MPEATEGPLPYYAQQGVVTEPGEQASLLDGLPTDPAALRDVVQGVLLHLHWASRYGVDLTEARKAEASTRQVGQMLARIHELDARPLTTARPLGKRLVGTCRDFATLLCAMLRHQGVPARARCGFGAYFTPERYEDHWVGEYWHAGEARWVRVDAQLDAMQCEALQIDFDPLDVPHDRFLVAGKAWQMCRSGEADPDHFGIFDMWGLWFVRGNLVRDLAALNKVELLPWDWQGWPLIERQKEALSEADLALLDRAAALTLADNDSFTAVRAIYTENADFQPPAGWQP